MNRTRWVGALGFLLAGCASGTAATTDDAAAPATSAASTSTTVAPAQTSAAPVASATTAPSASAATTTEPESGVPGGEYKTPEERKFISELAGVFNAELGCKAGISGDGRILIKDGKIVTFETIQTVTTATGTKDEVQKVAKLTGKKVPPMPESLKKHFEQPVTVLTCFGY